MTPRHNPESAPLKYLSICSGIEAASVAWHDLGFIPVGFSEIEPFPCAVLKHRFPKVPNLGDMTKFKDWKINEPIDLLVGGTPCQAFSVAGLRNGLADPRGNLTLTFLGIVEQFRPRWVVWENVPGVLSEKSGAFGSFLGGLGKIGYGWAYRVLDAQFFGVAQRRRRVFVVGHAGAWQRAAAVLFEPESLRGDSAPSREAGKRAAQTISARPTGGGGLGTDFDLDGGLVPSVVGTLSDGAHNGGGSTGKTPTRAESLSPAKCLSSKNQRLDFETETLIPCTTLAVRRLTPRECERLQGLPDDWTLIPWRKATAENCPDGPRYKALGNSMAVPVMRWIGQRIAKVDMIGPDEDEEEDGDDLPLNA